MPTVASLSVQWTQILSQLLLGCLSGGPTLEVNLCWTLNRMDYDCLVLCRVMAMGGRMHPLPCRALIVDHPCVNPFMTGLLFIDRDAEWDSAWRLRATESKRRNATNPPETPLSQNVVD